MSLWEALAASWPGAVAGLVFFLLLSWRDIRARRRSRVAEVHANREAYEQEQRDRDRERRAAQRAWADTAVRTLEATGPDCTCDVDIIEEHAICEPPREIRVTSRHDPDCPTHWPLKETR